MKEPRNDGNAISPLYYHHMLYYTVLDEVWILDLGSRYGSYNPFPL